jgi:hypothetical protein
MIEAWNSRMSWCYKCRNPSGFVTSASGAAGRQRQQFSVKRNVDVADDEDRDKEGCKVCEEWNTDYGDPDEGINESYCENCDICSCFYTCNCSDGHSLCEHVHKVHSLNEKVNVNFISPFYSGVCTIYSITLVSFYIHLNTYIIIQKNIILSVACGAAKTTYFGTVT